MARYEVPIWEYLNLIVAERNIDIIKLLLDVLKSSLQKLFFYNISLECTVIITIGVMFHCKSHVSFFLLPNVIIFPFVASYATLPVGSEQFLSVINTQLRLINSKSKCETNKSL